MPDVLIVLVAGLFLLSLATTICIIIALANLARVHRLEQEMIERLDVRTPTRQKSRKSSGAFFM